MTRWRVACDACGASAWIGPGGMNAHAWCECCQEEREPDRSNPAWSARCPACGGALATSEPRFLETFGDLQNLHAVLAAWAGDPAPLEELLPERPRYLSELTPPPAHDEDPARVRVAFVLLGGGSFVEARARLEKAIEEGPGTHRLWHALGIASERTGDLRAAEDAYSRALDLAESSSVRLARGALRARRGEYAGARDDLLRAGDLREARWNRAALRLVEAVAATRGFPGSETIHAARMEAGPPSSYWSEPTIGRLLWSLVVERELVRMRDGVERPNGAESLRRAEAELEFDTFWDRALAVHGYRVVGMSRDAESAAEELAKEMVPKILDQPFLRSIAAKPIRESLERIADAIRDGDAAGAAKMTRALMERPDVGRYRIPCARCGSGTVGVDWVEEPGE